MPLRFVNIFVLLVSALKCVSSEKFYPVLLWHSAGETCCDREGDLYAKFIGKELNNEVTVRSVSMGSTKDDDFTKSLTVHPFEQINIVCNKLKNNPEFKDGYNAVGFSQGALFFRGLAQICPFPPMKNLISLGGPQQGVNQYPRCNQTLGAMRCNLIQLKLNFKAYRYIFQKFLTPASYWHDVNEDRYRRGSTFLAVINNENHYNADYVKNLQSLKRIVLVKYMKDISLIPNESAWFGYIDANSRTVTMQETNVYKKNRLGLEQLKNEGKLMLLESPLQHLELDEQWFRQNIIPILREK